MPFVIMRLTDRDSGRQWQDGLRAVQRLHLTLLVHTQQDRMIRRIHIQPNNVPHLSTNCGSLENLKFSTRCGCSPKACQIRTIAVCESPAFLAINRLLQCVLWSGIDSSVLVITSSTRASVIERGAPAAARRGVLPTGAHESVPAICRRSLR